MPQSRFADREERLATEGREKYRGTARIRLEVLHFPRGEPRELDRKNIEKLKKCFEKGQCDRVTRNHIPAVIDQSQLAEVLRDSSVSAERLLNNDDSPHPTLKFPAGFQLHCLHGHHRIQAAREILTPRERWWTVDLYLADADHELKTALIEEYSNEKPPTAGEIYCKISQYRRERDLYSERRWWSHLSRHETRCLNGLFRHPELHTGFDDLLDLPGLWDGMRISTLNKMISMNFPEAVVHYLEDIKEFWSQLFAYNKQAMRMLDNATVKAVELMAPRHSRRDAQILHGQLASGQIFAAFSPQDRDTIWSKLRTASGLIPSLFTLFEDLKYLQACAGSMRHLVEPAPGQTLSVALDDKFFGSTENWDLAYRRLWLYSMEYYSKLPAPSKKDTKKNRLAKAGIAKPDEVVVSNFAALADQLGFQSDQISALKKRSSDREIALIALLNARKPDRYEYTEQSLESHIDQIIRLFATATPLSLEQSCPTFVSDDPAGAGVRCGFPNEEAHARDAKSLVIANLHAVVDEQGESVTSFFVRRSVYFAFFGRPSETSTKRRSNPAPHTGGGIHVDLQQERLGTLGGERDALGQGRPSPQEEARMVQERMTQDLLERNTLQRERQASVGDHRNGREGDDASKQSQRNQRRGTQVDLEKSIADGLARTSEHPEDPPQSSPPAVNLEALVNSYQDLIRTDDVDASAHGQPYEQNPDRQLQIIPPSSMVRIEFKIHERDVWRTDRSLLVDSSDPSEVERVAKKYMRKGIRPFDSSLNLLVPRMCFQAAIADGSNTILLVPENSIQVNNQLVKFVPDAMSDGKLSTKARVKRNR